MHLRLMAKGVLFIFILDCENDDKKDRNHNINRQANVPKIDG